MDITEFGNPKKVKKICEWSGKEFVVDWKHRKQRFIDSNAMYEWRKFNNRETVPCVGCGKLFERCKRISNYKKKLPTQYCSLSCSLSSSEKRENLRKWGLSDKNHWNQKGCQDKVKETKLRLYGSFYYNNMEKNQNTMMERYGVPCALYLPHCQSNGKRISKFQKRIYVEMLKIYPDAILEYYLPDVKKFVDIYVPSRKNVIECHGDYWHCNPEKCSREYYNKSTKMKAHEIWDRDEKKKKLLEEAGYIVEVIWENSSKKFKHFNSPN